MDLQWTKLNFKIRKQWANPDTNRTKCLLVAQNGSHSDKDILKIEQKWTRKMAKKMSTMEHNESNMHRITDIRLIS